MERDAEPRRFYKRPIVWGWFGTGIVGAIGLLAAFSKACVAAAANLDDCPTKWAYLVSSTPNELGDTLAGFAGALAFIWIIVTVAMQSLELAAQREELSLTRKEFSRMAGAQDRQVELLVKQGEIFSAEQRQRDESRAQTLLDEKLRSLVFAISESPERGLGWHFSNGDMDDPLYSTSDIFSRFIGNRSDESLALDEAVNEQRRRLSGIHENLWDLLHQSIDYRLPKETEVLSELIRMIQSITKIRSDLSPSQQERLERMRLGEMIASLEKLLATPELWEAELE